MTHSPLLLVALIGFDPPKHKDLATLLAECCALGARWRVAAPVESDLWIVDGAHAHRLPGNVLEARATPPLRFRPWEMKQPVVFAQPLHDSLAGNRSFDAGSIHSLSMLLTQLGPALMPRVAQQVLVAHLVSNGASFTRSNVIHVREGGRLLAVLDFEGDTGVAPDATPSAIRRADWLLQPRGDAAVPPGFHTASTQEVLWRFATRAEGIDLLPGRYLRLPIYLRRMPGLPPRELADRHLALLRELAYAPRTLADLGDRIGVHDQALRRDLGALYLIGAITCDPGRSRATRERRRAALLERDDELLLLHAHPSSVGELTAPGFARH